MIDPPKIESVGDVYVLTYSNSVKIKVDHIYEDKASVSAEVVISVDNKHLSHSRLNLLYPPSKRSLAKELSERVELDWQAIIEYATVLTLREYRKGDPVVRVGNLPERTKPKYRLYPYILDGEMSSLYGYGGSAKSYMALLWAVLILTGESALSFQPLQCQVLYLDWETTKYTVDERVKAIKRGMNIASSELPLYRRCSRQLTYDIAEIQRIVMDNKIGLAIIDSVGMASGLDGEWHSAAINMLRAVRSLGISALLIDHKPKKENSMFGSIYKTNEVRSAFEIKAKQNPGELFLDTAIFHTKVNDGALTKPQGFHLDFYGNEERTERAVFQRQEVRDMPDFAENLSLRDQVQGILRDGKLSVKDITEELDATEGTVRSTLNRYKDVFVRIGEEWGLLSKDIA